jgi:hypothetical protein
MSDHLEFAKAQRLGGANIETSVRCALRCPQCQRAWLGFGKSHPRYKEIKTRINEGGDLLIENFEKIIKFANRNVNLCGQISDPIYWPALRDAVIMMKDHPFKRLIVSTAGHQKNIEWYKDIFSVCPQNVIWKFGLDGIGKTSEIYRKGQNSELIWEAMLLAKDMGLQVEWQFIVFEHNVLELEEAKLIANEHNIPMVIISTDRDFNGVKPPKGWKAARNKVEIRA